MEGRKLRPSLKQASKANYTPPASGLSSSGPCGLTESASDYNNNLRTPDAFDNLGVVSTASNNHRELLTSGSATPMNGVMSGGLSGGTSMRSFNFDASMTSTQSNKSVAKRFTNILSRASQKAVRAGNNMSRRLSAIDMEAMGIRSLLNKMPQLADKAAVADAAEELGIHFGHESEKQTVWIKSMLGAAYSRQVSRLTISDDEGLQLSEEQRFAQAFRQLGLRDVDYADRFQQVMGMSVWQDFFGADVSDGANVPLSCVHSKLIQRLDCLHIICTFWSVIFAPVAFVFGPAELPPVTITLDKFFSAAFFVTVMFRLLTSFIDRGGVEIQNRRSVLRHNLTQMFFWSQLASTLHIILAVPFPEGSSYPFLLEIVRCISLWKLPHSLHWWSKHSVWFQIISLILSLVLLSHVFSCIWISFNGYKREFFVFEGEAFVYHFVYPGLEPGTFHTAECSKAMALYLAAYLEVVFMLTGVGVDDPLGLEPENPRHRNAGCLAMIAVLSTAGCLFSSFIFSNFVIALQQMKNLDIKHGENLSLMREAMRTLRVPHELQHRIVMYQHFQNLNHSRIAMDVLFDPKNITAALKTELCIFLHHRSVRSCPFLSDLRPHILVEVVLALDDDSFLPGDYLIRQGDVGHECYFLQQGEVAIVEGNTNLFLLLLHSGDYFGEFALIGDQRRDAWVRSNTYTICSILERDRLEIIFGHFPDQKKILHEKMIQTLARRRLATNAMKLGGLNQASMSNMKKEDLVKFDENGLPVTRSMTSCAGTKLRQRKDKMIQSSQTRDRSDQKYINSINEADEQVPESSSSSQDNSSCQPDATMKLRSPPASTRSNTSLESSPEDQGVSSQASTASTAINVGQRSIRSIMTPSQVPHDQSTCTSMSAPLSRFSIREPSATNRSRLDQPCQSTQICSNLHQGNPVSQIPPTQIDSNGDSTCSPGPGHSRGSTSSIDCHKTANSDVRKKHSSDPLKRPKSSRLSNLVPRLSRTSVNAVEDIIIDEEAKEVLKTCEKLSEQVSKDFTAIRRDSISSQNSKEDELRTNTVSIPMRAMGVASSKRRSSAAREDWPQRRSSFNNLPVPSVQSTHHPATATTGCDNQGVIILKQLLEAMDQRLTERLESYKETADAQHKELLARYDKLEAILLKGSHAASSESSGVLESNSISC